MTLRIGIIGSGFVEQHILALAQLDEAKVVAICSRNEKKARKLVADEVSYYSFNNYVSMLKRERLDAVYICLPPSLLSEISATCAAHVGALFIEKPVAIDLSQARRTQDVFERKGITVCVGYMNRYRQNLQSTKNYFANETAILVNAGWCDDLPPPYWWRQRKMSGGQLTEQCTHFLDAIRFVAGEVEEVSAYATGGFIDDVEDFNVDDAVVMNFRLTSGAIGNVMTSCFSRAAGTGPGLFLNFSSREKTYHLQKACLDLSIQHSAKEKEIIPSGENAILAENRAFIHSLVRGDTGLIQSSYADAIETLKFSLAADLSIKEKRTVRLCEL